MATDLEDRLAALEQQLDAATRQTPARRPRSRHVIRTALLSLGIIAVIAGLGSGAWFGYRHFERQQRQDIIPAAIREVADFPIYVPELSGYAVDPKTANYSNAVLTYTVKQAESAKYIVTQQRQPQNFDLSRFTKGEGIKNAKQLQLATGTGLTGDVAGNHIVMLATQDDSLVTISKLGDSPLTDSQFLAGLKPLD